MTKKKSHSNWDGPKDLYTFHKDGSSSNNKKSISISIAKYWDVYAPPPKETTKGRIGNSLPFLRDTRGRRRRLSLEKHSPKSSKTGGKVLLRVSKPRDGDEYKTKYLIELVTFEIVSIDTEKKEVSYNTYDNGVKHEGSFIFDNNTIEEVLEFQALLRQSVMQDETFQQEIATSTASVVSSASTIDNSTSKEEALSSPDRFTNDHEGYTYARSSIASLVERRDEEIQKIISEAAIEVMSPDHKYNDGSVSPSVSAHDDNSVKKQDPEKGTHRMTTPKRLTQDNIPGTPSSAPAPAVRVRSPLPSRSQGNSPISKHGEYHDLGGGNGASASVKSKRASSKSPFRLKPRQKQRIGANSREEDFHDGPALFYPKSSSPKSLKAASPPLTPPMNPSPEPSASFSPSHRSSASNNSPSTNTDIETGNRDVDNPDPPLSPTASIVSTNDKGIFYKCFHGSAMIIATSIHTLGLLVGFALNIYALLLISKANSLANAYIVLFTWAGLIFTAHMSGLLGSYGKCFCPRIWLKSSILIGILLFIGNGVIICAIALKQSEFIAYLKENAEKLLLSEADVEFFEEHIFLVYKVMAVVTAFELFRMFVVRKLLKDANADVVRQEHEHDELSEPLIERS